MTDRNATEHADYTAPMLAQPLPEARQLRRALESIGVTTYSRHPGPPNPHGERGDAAQYAGILHGCLEQIENGLRGGPLQTQWQKGWLGVHQEHPAQSNPTYVLASLGMQLRDLSGFAGSGIVRIPLASRQLSTAALAMLVAYRALLAAAEIAGETPDLKAAEWLSDLMVANAHQLTVYVAHLEREFGPSSSDPDVVVKL
ncbi:hypothetical protein [Nocardia wallacei]|uniref:hypothetical protein n=1 Tax=Nocardia wallacei TaxID=480035 RepID=UPI002458F3C5|nr:hypothetical protein [Nocardia wallacei]